MTTVKINKIKLSVRCGSKIIKRVAVKQGTKVESSQGEKGSNWHSVLRVSPVEIIFRVSVTHLAALVIRVRV